MLKPGKITAACRQSLVLTAAAAALIATSACGFAMSMKDAVARAVESNPQIEEAIANRVGIEFELEQARGLYRPRVDLEGSIGGELRDSPTTREENDDDHLFVPKQGSLVIRQLLFDGFGTEAEIERQASRVDGASLRIWERSEFIALAVIREYLDIARLRRMVGLSQENIRYHQRILGEIEQGTGGGTLSIADRQQAQERIFAARAQLADIQLQLKDSEAVFIKLVGGPVGATSSYINVKGNVPRSLQAAIERARAHHPSIAFARADIDAAAAQVKAAESKFYPKLSLEGRAVAGDDLGGQRGWDGDLQGNLVLNWNLYNGGIDRADVQEQIRHVDEAYQVMHRIGREVEEGVRLSWNQRTQQRARLRELLREVAALDELRVSYAEQFKIGQRSLLDLLDTQNTRFAAQVAVATSDAAARFADYRMLAATGDLLKTVGIARAAQSRPYARQDANVPETPSPDSFNRVDPPAPKQ
jgi:adhesin transport system outer membrane protein